MHTWRRHIIRGLSRPSRTISSPISQPLARRNLHLAPPFLLDSYTPRYQLLSSAEASRKRSLAHSHLSNCNLCPRNCSINRYQKTGVCLIGAETVKVSTIAPHFGEEPCIQGHSGSGSVFFSGCNLRCAFCQNHSISHSSSGFSLTPTELGDWFLRLQSVGNVHNINLVTPEHVVPQVVLAILHAAENGLNVPVVYNTSAYDSLASLELLDGLVDVYLPDFKVWSESASKRLLKVGDYAEHARRSIRAMWEQVGDLCFTGDGLAVRGVLIRHLVMPGMEKEGRRIMQWIASEEGVGKDAFVNVMEQYRPDAHVGKGRRGTGSRDGRVGEAGGEEVRYAEINRPVRMEEVRSVRQAAEEVGLWRFADPPKHGGWNL